MGAGRGTSEKVGLIYVPLAKLFPAALQQIRCDSQSIAAG